MRKIILGFFELCIHIVIYAFVIFLVYRAAVFAYDFSYNIFGDPVMSKYDSEVVTVVVDDGDSASTVASKLKMDADLKAQADALFTELGMNLTTAFNIFVRQSLRLGSLKFK